MNIKIAWLIVLYGLCLAPLGFAGKKNGIIVTPHSERCVVDPVIYRLIHESGLLRKDFPRDIRNSIANLLMQDPNQAPLVEELQYALEENVECKEENVFTNKRIVQLAKYARSCEQAQEYVVVQLNNHSFAKWKIGNSDDVDIFDLNCSSESKLWVAGNRLIACGLGGEFTVFNLETKKILAEGRATHHNIIVLDEDTYLTFSYSERVVLLEKGLFNGAYSCFTTQANFEKFSSYSSLECDVQNNHFLIFSNNDKCGYAVSLEWRYVNHPFNINSKGSGGFIVGSSKIIGDLFSDSFYCGTNLKKYTSARLQIMDVAANKKEFAYKKPTPWHQFKLLTSVSLSDQLIAVSERKKSDVFSDYNKSSISFITLSNSYYRLNQKSTIDLKAHEIEQFQSINNRLIIFTKHGDVKIYKVTLHPNQLASFLKNKLTCAQAILLTCISNARKAGKKLALPLFLNDTYRHFCKIIEIKFGNNTAQAIKNELENHIAKVEDPKK